MKTQNRYSIILIALSFLTCNMAALALPLGTAFTYQGRLLVSGEPANGTYDLHCVLYDAWAEGNQIGSILLLEDVQVDDGYFIADLDFGANAFTGEARYLAIGVRPGSSTDDYTQLLPRVEVKPSLYSLQTRGIFVGDDFKVGIGTTGPMGKLHVATEPFYGDIIFLDGGSGTNDLSIDLSSSYTDTIPRIYIVQITSDEDPPDKFKWSDDNGDTWSSDQLSITTEWYDLSYGVRIKWDDEEAHLTGDTWFWGVMPSEPNALVVQHDGVGIGTASPQWELEVVNKKAGEGTEAAVVANDAGCAIAAYSSTFGFPFEHFAGRASVFTYLDTLGLDIRADGVSGDIRFFTGGLAETNERARITVDGNVGVGTTIPEAKLHSVSTGVTMPGVYGENLSTGYGVYGKSASIGVYGEGQRGVYAKSSTMYGIYSDAPENYFSGNMDVSGNVDVSGNIEAAVLVITGGSDLAEPFKVTGSDSVEPGMVVAIDPDNPGQLRIADKAYDRTVAGIVSGANGVNPGMTMRQDDTLASGSTMVALTGRVYCYADASYGAIEPGDMLTTSEQPGHAMKATDISKSQGAILGKAMTSLDKGKGLVLVLVTLQ